MSIGKQGYFVIKLLIMSMFISKALRRAEVFLEQVDESVAQASRRLVVEGATGAVNEDDTDFPSDDETTSVSRASTIPKAENRTRVPPLNSEEQVGDAWNDDIVIDDTLPYSTESDAADFSSPTEDDNVEPPKQPEDIAFQPDRHEDSTLTLPSQTKPIEESNSHPQMSVPAFIPSSSSHAAISTKPVISHKQPVSTANPSAFVHENEFVGALQAENEDLRKELEAVEADFEKSRRERTKLVKNLKRLKEVVSEMDESLRDKSSENRQLNDQLLQVREELEVLHAERKQKESRGQDELQALRSKLSAEITKINSELGTAVQKAEFLQQENERLNEALLQGHEVELATADGARQEASQAHRAYEAESFAHRQTREQAKEREEALQEEAALAAIALAGAQRKAEECTEAASVAKAAQRVAESKLMTVIQARDAAFGRIEDLEEALRLFERNEGQEAPGQREAKAMHQTVSELENALEAKNLELTRLEGELEGLRAKTRRDGTSPRTPNANRNEANNQQEVEQKMRHMADAALRKQAQLEVLRSENRALQHQLTTERKRTREAQAMAAAASSSQQTIRGGFRGILDSGEDNRGDRMYGLRDGPLARFRTPRSWPKPIAKAITGLDRFSAQALAFLRKEPLLRIVVLLYMAAVHLFIYSLLHWHVDAVSRSTDVTHGRVSSAVKAAVTK